jgi:hypothetical protein
MDLARREFSRTCSGDYYQVYPLSEILPTLPKPLSDGPLDTIPHHGFAYPTAYRHTEARLLDYCRLL